MEAILGAVAEEEIDSENIDEIEKRRRGRRRSQGSRSSRQHDVVWVGGPGFVGPVVMSHSDLRPGVTSDPSLLDGSEGLKTPLTAQSDSKRTSRVATQPESLPKVAREGNAGERRRTSSKVKALVLDGVVVAQESGLPLSRSITWEDEQTGNYTDGSDIDGFALGSQEDSKESAQSEIEDVDTDGEERGLSGPPRRTESASATGSQSEYSSFDPYGTPWGGGGGIFGFPDYPTNTETDWAGSQAESFGVTRTGGRFAGNFTSSVSEPHVHQRNLGGNKSLRELQIEEKARRLPMWRKDVRSFMRDHKSSRWAQIFSWIFMTTVIVSTVSMCLATLPSLEVSDKAHVAFFFIEMTCGVLFTVEICLNLLGMASVWEVLSWWFVIDLLATLPIWGELLYVISVGADPLHNSVGVTGLATLRVLRLMRVFRLFRIAGKSGKIQLLLSALVESRNGILALLYALVTIVAFFSTLIYYAEQTGEYYQEGYWYYVEDNSISAFQSIPHTFWFTLVTLTTIGYGDVTPKTPLGKTAASLAIVSSLFVIAFPLTMITFQFSHLLRRWEANQHAKIMRRKHMKLAEKDARKKLRLSGLHPKRAKKRFTELTQKALKQISLGSQEPVIEVTSADETSLVRDSKTVEMGNRFEDRGTNVSISNRASPVQPSQSAETLHEDAALGHDTETSPALNPPETINLALADEKTDANDPSVAMTSTAPKVAAVATTSNHSRLDSKKGLSFMRTAATRGTPLPKVGADEVPTITATALPQLLPTRGTPPQKDKEPPLALTTQRPQLIAPRSSKLPNASLNGLVPHLFLFEKETVEPEPEVKEDSQPEEHLTTISELVASAALGVPVLSLYRESNSLDVDSQRPTENPQNLLRVPVKISGNSSVGSNKPNTSSDVPKVPSPSRRKHLQARHMSFSSKSSLGVIPAQGDAFPGDVVDSVDPIPQPSRHQSRHMSFISRSQGASDLYLRGDTLDASLPRSPFATRDLACYNLPLQIPIPTLVGELGTRTPSHVELKVCDFESWYSGEDDIMSIKIAVRDQTQFVTFLRILMSFQVLE